MTVQYRWEAMKSCRQTIQSRHWDTTQNHSASSRDLITVCDEEEHNVLEEGYMRAEQDVTEHPLGVQVNECY